jgi:hypothetical protein
MILTILSMLVGRPTEQLARRRSGPVFLPPGALSRLALAPCLVFCLALPVYADAGVGPVVTGWIDTFEGEAEDYRVVRGDRVLSVYPLMRLRAGDRIEIGEGAGPMRVQVSETEELVIDQARSPYLVPDGGELAGPWANLLKWAAALFDGHEGGHGATTVKIKSRGDASLPPTSGLLFIERVKLVAGRRALALAWSNGEPPFSIGLTRLGAAPRPVLEATDIADSVWVSPALELAPGTYLLEILDHQQRDLTTEIEVVEPAAAPRLDPGSVPADVPAQTLDLLAAAWLAGQDDGWVWRLEAYQALAGIGDLEAAVALSDYLMRPRGLPIDR